MTLITPDLSSAEIKRYIGEYMHIHTDVRIPAHLLKRADITVEHIADELLVSVKTYIESMTHHKEWIDRNGPRTVLLTTRVPSNWWQHVKHDLFPDWLKRRFPVEYNEIETLVQDEVHMTSETVNVCPFINTGDNKKKYFEFLVHGGWRGQDYYLP